MKKLLLLLFLVNNLVNAQSSESGQHARRYNGRRSGVVTNPNVHDPVMWKQDSTFYLFYTGMLVGQLSSTDLVNWKFEVPALTQVPAWAVDSVKGYRGHTWAPDIVQRDGMYHLYYSCSTFGKNTSAIGHAQKDNLDPSVPWHDTGAVVLSHESDNFNAIDPSVIVDENGTPWMFFGSFWGGIQLIRLTSDMCHVDPSYSSVMVAKRARGKAIEAPFVYRHGDWYYLFVSWDYCCRGKESNYKVMVGRSKNVEGPYVDRRGRLMSEGGGTFVYGDNFDFVAAGHSAAYTFDGEDYFMCHGYTRETGESKLVLRKLAWDEGWPVVQE